MKRLITAVINKRRNSMLAEMMLRSDEEGRGVIQLTVPSANTIKVAEAIRGVLSLAGHKVRRVNSEGEEVVSADEVFPDGCPAMALRGLRGKEEITQAELAARLGVSQNAISEMESGKRPISTKMAKRLGEEFNLPYKVFL
ncbi:helix-turn-helix transcriptional regulator [uncultured Desulfovibrio sp.]|uniref:helix-turn-helix transcriptional regulator n=1 Tax=uncultured Desulfovibrio sp. TaxID=167968 RepID=UPI00260ECDE5|nr:helix-turn-helix transcriptional regulator [uncultured Desulfovibrio sp.]